MAQELTSHSRRSNFVFIERKWNSLVSIFSGLATLAVLGVLTVQLKLETWNSKLKL